MSAPLRQTNQVLNLQPARVLFLMHTFRLLAYQILIVVCQYAAGIVVFSLLIMELAKTFFIIRAELKYRIFATRITLVAEVLQSVFLQSFLILSAGLHTKSFKETVSNESQQFGVYLIIGSIVAEYLMLVVSIVYQVRIAVGEYKAKKARE